MEGCTPRDATRKVSSCDVAAGGGGARKRWPGSTSNCWPSENASIVVIRARCTIT